MPVRDLGRYSDRSPDQLLRTLIDGNDGVDLTVGPLRLRIGNIPLFRDDGDLLRQGVRIAVAGEVDSELTLSIGTDDIVLDERRIEPGPVTRPVLLFVPEVTEETPFQVRAAVAGEEPVSVKILVQPQRKWSVHLIHHSHYDIGYTDPQATVINSHLGFIDSALDLIAATDDWPEDSQFRWVVEVTDPLRHWLDARPKASRDELFRRAREGRIEINGLPFSMHSEAYSVDEIAHQMHSIWNWREQHGVEIVSAMQSDVPGAATGLVTLLANAGIKYLSVAHNYAGRSVPHFTGGQQLTRPFYWQAPDGNRVLTWMTDSTLGMAYMEGNHAGLVRSFDAAQDHLTELLAAIAQRPFPYGRDAFNWAGTHQEFDFTKQPYAFDVLHLRVQGVFADNAPPNLLVGEIARRWNETWAYPRLRLSTNRAFFEEIESRHGDRFATYGGDWTDWWADGIGSGALPLGLNRKAQSDVRTAQTLHALADAVLEPEAPQGKADVLSKVDDIYDNMALFDEHTWGAANPWRESISMADSGALQWARKAAFAYHASERTDALLEAGLHRLAPLATVGGESIGIAVINPSSWPRTDLVRVFVPESRLFGTAEFRILEEATGGPVSYVREGQLNPSNRPSGCWVTFLARDVPPMGYARYVLEQAPTTPDTRSREPVHVDSTAATIQSDAFRVTANLSEAHIAELVDLATGRDVIDHAAPFGFNEYVYDVYATAPGFNHLSSRVAASDLAFLGSRSTARDAVVIDRQSNAVWERLTLRATGENLSWLETTVTLPYGIDRVDISHRLLKTATMAKESVYFAFPFAADDPKMTFEITGDLFGPDSPKVPGSASHFRAIRHWIGLQGNGGSQIAWATGEAPLVQTGTIHLPYVPYPSTLSAGRDHPGTIYSWALNNIWDTNFPSQQGGEMVFRYAIGMDDKLPLADLGRRTATSVTSPLIGVCSPRRSAPHGRTFESTGSFCAVDHPNVAVTHLAPSRQGHDLVAFVESTASEPVTTRVEFGLLPVARATIGTIWERSGDDASLDGNGLILTIPAGTTLAISLDLL